MKIVDRLSRYGNEQYLDEGGRAAIRQAVATIDRITAENERLRKALERILNEANGPSNDPLVRRRVYEISIAAIAVPDADRQPATQADASEDRR